MNFNQLKYFSAVCTFQNVSDAAEYLHISQPSLSNAIKELEKEFGVTLFKRHHRGMSLTPEGEVLHKMSRDILSRTEQTENIMKDLGRERKRIRLGVPPMIGSIILPVIYRSFFADNRYIILEIAEGGSCELKQKLLNDYLDMIFIPHNQRLSGEFSGISVAKLETVYCTTKNNPHSGKKSITPKELEGTPLVLFENSFFQTEEIKKLFVKDSVKPEILMQTGQLSTMLSIISDGQASGFMFRQLVEKNSELVAVSLKEPMYAEVSLVWKKDAYFTGSMQKFKEYINNKRLFKEI